MGFSNSWIAIQGKSRSTVLHELQLREVGNPEPFSDWPIGAAELPGGWYLLFLDDVVHRYTEDKFLETHSIDSHIVVCQFEEHVMVSSAFAFRNGVKEWDVTHDAQVSRTHLEETGKLPVEYAAIHNSLMEQQLQSDRENQGVDYIWDVPVTLAYAVVGFRHDNVELKHGGEPKFFELVAQ
jgi:hypothetical protein